MSRVCPTLRTFKPAVGGISEHIELSKRFPRRSSWIFELIVYRMRSRLYIQNLVMIGLTAKKLQVFLFCMNCIESAHCDEVLTFLE